MSTTIDEVKGVHFDGMTREEALARHREKHEDDEIEMGLVLTGIEMAENEDLDAAFEEQPFSTYFGLYYAQFNPRG